MVPSIVNGTVGCGLLWWLVGVPFVSGGLDYASLYPLERGGLGGEGVMVRLLRALPSLMGLPQLSLVLSCHGGVAVPSPIYACGSATQSFGCQIISLLTCSEGMTSWEIRYGYDVRSFFGLLYFLKL
jgi:hypothetical protein